MLSMQYNKEVDYFFLGIIWIVEVQTLWSSLYGKLQVRSSSKNEACI
jgi:hypothetical protein